MVELLVA
jgi:hypothetical protein